MRTIYYNGTNITDKDMPITKEIIIAYVKHQTDYQQLGRRARAKLVGGISREYKKQTLNIKDYECDSEFIKFFNYYYYKKSMQEHFDTKCVAKVRCYNQAKYIGVDNEQQANKWCVDNSNVLYGVFWQVVEVREIR